MLLLLLVTVIWAFSFSLIGVYLSGHVDPWFSVWIRIALATMVFLPFIKPKQISLTVAAKLMAIGAIQLGVMYSFYYQSFLFLTVPEVLLFTVMTPIYVTLFNDLLDRKLHRHFFFSALLATIGAIAIRYHSVNEGFLRGLVMVQGANLCFAAGQVAYKRLLAKQTQALEQKSVFSWFFIGALIVSSIEYLLWGDANKLPQTTLQWGILIYLGIVASGWGYFAWNKGATQVNVGALAVTNNLLIPTGIIVNVMIWNHNADLFRLSVGAILIIAALILNQKWAKHRQHRRN
ncbi:DMT family transporter [Celerinatantimonas yamalensis]|uniref:DMT family transporter n=1 Tax=Celerinatantimonas yamalensis TaxID=559956 RepID=A0ABW9GB95_9GAMM